jgi:hypothetical protein
MTGAEAIRVIDWIAVGAGAPIPDLMPATQSDDPVEAGFARQWVERAVFPIADSVSFRLALEIVSKHRTRDDHWAYAMEKQLRGVIQAKVPNSRNARVFCNSIGCLCYTEWDESFLKTPIIYGELRGETGQRVGLEPSDVVDAVWHLVRPGIPW